MDSLLASYGSDEDDADSPAGSPKPVLKTSAAPAPSWNRQSIFSSLPPPRNSAPEASMWDDEDDQDEHLKPETRIEHREGDRDRPAPRTSLFTSLPPPRSSAPENSDWGEPLKRSAGASRDRALQPVYDDRAETDRGGSPFSVLPPPTLDSAALPSGFFDDATSVSSAERRPHDDDIPERGTGMPSSLFARLPPPASSKPLFEKLPPPSASKPPTVPRKVVAFKPPVNLALLEATDEDDLERSRKRSKLQEESDRATKPKAGGLAALLPPPKNNLGSGAALGGGGAHGGRRTVMETASDSHKMAKEVNSNSGKAAHKSDGRNLEKAEVNVARPAVAVSNYGYGFEASAQSREASYVQAERDTSYYDPEHQYSGQPSAQNQVGSGDEYLGRNEQQSWQYPDASAFGSGSQASQGQGSSPTHVLAEVMKKERRKGRDEPPPDMIEVKQADLTGGAKLREDQLRTTGIAFGPSYKPVASNKDKPSKIHRRKHQIGALYFDMKQNEMNLLDRRSKGSLTKAETQAKYGW